MAQGKLQVKLDPHCSKFRPGLEGVYDAQKYMRTGKNVGKIYVAL